MFLLQIRMRWRNLQQRLRRAPPAWETMVLVVLLVVLCWSRLGNLLRWQSLALDVWPNLLCPADKRTSQNFQQCVRRAPPAWETMVLVLLLVVLCWSRLGSLLRWQTRALEVWPKLLCPAV